MFQVPIATPRENHIIPVLVRPRLVHGSLESRPLDSRHMTYIGNSIPIPHEQNLDGANRFK